MTALHDTDGAPVIIGGGIAGLKACARPPVPSIRLRFRNIPQATPRWLV
jgi:hypothetical protein